MIIPESLIASLDIHATEQDLREKQVILLKGPMEIPSMEPYARLKGRLRFTTHGAALRLHLKRTHAYRPVPHLDPAIRARLESALQRLDLKPATRAKIEAALKP